MGFAVIKEVEKVRQENPDLHEKNCVWGNFKTPNKTHLANRRQPLKPQQKKPTYAYKIASGRPVWPSRDPIGEKGGINLYEFIENNGINGIDFLGLEINDAWDALARFRSGAGGTEPAGPELLRSIVNGEDYKKVSDEIYDIIVDKLEKADHAKSSGTVTGKGHRGLNNFVMGSYKLNIFYKDPWKATPWVKVDPVDALFLCGRLSLSCESRIVTATVGVDFDFADPWDFHPNKEYGPLKNFFNETAPGAIAAAGTKKAKDFTITGSFTEIMKFKVRQCR